MLMDQKRRIHKKTHQEEWYKRRRRRRREKQTHTHTCKSTSSILRRRHWHWNDLQDFVISFSLSLSLSENLDAGHKNLNPRAPSCEILAWVARQSSFFSSAKNLDFKQPYLTQIHFLLPKSSKKKRMKYHLGQTPQPHIPPISQDSILLKTQIFPQTQVFSRTQMLV